MTPAFPSQELRAAEARSTAVNVSANTRAAFKLNADPRRAVLGTSCRMFLTVNKAAYMQATIPIADKGFARAISAGRLVAARTAANSTTVATVDSTAPATAGRDSAGCS